MNTVEHIGSGINRIRKACKDYGVDSPTMQVEENWVSLVFQRPTAEKEATEHVTVQANMQDTDQDTDLVADSVKSLISLLEQEPMAISKTIGHLKLNHKPTFRKNYLLPALNPGLIEMTIPDKPSSRLQMYRLTKKGMQKLAK